MYGICEKCNKPAPLECADCYAIIKYKGEPHNCPSLNSGEILKPILCSLCY